MLLQRDRGDAVKAAIAGFSFVISFVSSTYAASIISMLDTDMTFVDHIVFQEHFEHQPISFMNI